MRWHCGACGAASCGDSHTWYITGYWPIGKFSEDPRWFEMERGMKADEFGY
jgi:hypothetical protein